MRDLMEAELNRKENSDDDDDDDQNVIEKFSKVSIDDESKKKDTACALIDEKTNPKVRASIGQEEGAVKQCIEPPKQQIPNAEANLLTCHRQKLALMQCEYNPKCCSYCKKPGTGKSCAKCKTAKYCSKECQIQDWKEKHKIHCLEIRRLQETIDRDETNAQRGFTRVKATADGKPWFLDRGIEY